MEKFRYFIVLRVIFAIFRTLAYPGKKSETHGEPCHFGTVEQNVMKIQYPEVQRNETVFDNYHDVQIKDPYRWLEDPDSENTRAFIDAQNRLTTAFLSGCPIRQQINKNLTQLCDFPVTSCPMRQGNKYYFNYNTGLQNQSVLYVQDTLTSVPRIFLDPENLFAGGTYSVSEKVFSKNGKLLAISLSTNGSDWNNIRFMDTETGRLYPEILKKVKYSMITWTKDSKGIFYGSYHKQNEVTEDSVTRGVRDQKLFYHIVGTPQSEDVLVVEFPDEPLWRIGAQALDDEKWLLIFAMEDTEGTRIFQTKLSSDGKIEGKFNLTKIIDDPEAIYGYVTNDGPNAIFITNKNASNFQLITINLENSEEKKWSVLLPEHPSDVLNWVKAVDQDKFVACYIKDVKHVLQLHSLRTGSLLRTFPLDVGTIAEFYGEISHSEIFYRFTSFLTPGIIYTTNLRENKEPEVYTYTKMDNFDRSAYKTEQVFYTSKDGTEIPMFIIMKADAVLNGSMPVLLHGYGGFSVSMQPFFSAKTLLFLRHFNGVVAVANIRGGGEYGETWHDNGKLLNKQNSFDDFQYAAIYLIENNYTIPSKLIIEGSSNGGLLVAACINQRPDLFGAAIASVGVMDMLRYHKFTIGYAWVSEYGSSDDPVQFENLLKYSPLHTVKAPPNGVQFPATLLLTADHDDRVVPLHTLKLIATLQHDIGRLPNQRNPILARIENRAGHGNGKSLTKQIAEAADTMTFIARALGLTYKN